MLYAPRAIVFDLDDTLYPQASFKQSGFRALAVRLEGQGLASSDTAYAAFIRIMQQHGPSYGHLVDDALAELGLAPMLAAELIGNFRSHKPQITLYAGVATLLDRLRAHMPLGLLTDGLAAVQRRKVDVLALEGYFAEIVYSDDLNTQKPDRVLFEYFEQAFDLDAVQLMYVGDNPAKDFVGARERGWHTVRVTTGEHATAAIENDAYAPDITIDSVDQLERLLSTPMNSTVATE